MARDSKEILDLFSKATGMEINVGKSSLSTRLLDNIERLAIFGLFPYKLEEFDAGLKYLGFFLKPNSYQK